MFTLGACNFGNKHLRSRSTLIYFSFPPLQKIDPLMRIQEEIKEVKRREQEYRQLKSVTAGDSSGEYDDHNGNSNDNNNEHLSMSPVPPVATATPHMVAVVTSLALPVDDSSLASSVNSKESLDEHHHSDDSGISASSSPVNGTSANETKITVIKEKRYIGPNTYNMTPVVPPQKLLTRATSTPQIFTQHRIIAHSSAQKGLMQRFIASRGKIVLNNNSAAASNKLILNNNINYNSHSNSNNLDLSNGNSNGGTSADPDEVIAAAVNGALLTPDFTARNNTAGNIPTVTMTPPIIERDAEGKPIRRGYIPVEVKIQRELKDYKSRESELKKYRKIRESTPDLLDSIAME